jgi:hypothetical protein
LKAIARSLLLFASLLAFAGVADAKKPVNEVPPVKKDQAQIVFLRHSTVNARLSTLLYDTTSGTPRVVGLMGNHRKLVVDVPPGDYVFMIGSMPYCDFMKATVLADKRYNVVVIPKWMNSYSMRPVRHEGGQFWYWLRRLCRHPEVHHARRQGARVLRERGTQEGRGRLCREVGAMAEQASRAKGTADAATGRQ